MDELVIVPEDVWIKHAEPSDPLGVHWQYGVLAPRLKDGQWTVAFCPVKLLEPVKDCDDIDIQEWINYWCAHVDCHIIVRKEIFEEGERIFDPFEIEDRVDAMLYDLAENTFSKASKIMMEYLERTS